MKKAIDNHNFIAIISYDEEPATELAPGEYLEQEFGWLQQSGFKLSDWALVDHDVLWEQYLLYLANWIVEHSSEPCHKGPDSFSQWKDNCTSQVAEEPLYLIGCEENSSELAIENGPVNELTVLHTIDEALAYVQKRLQAAYASGYVLFEGDDRWADYTNEECKNAIRDALKDGSFNLIVCEGNPENERVSYSISVYKSKNI